MHSEEEERAIILGLSLLSRVLLVVHTERGERIRIISARKATPLERSQYETCLLYTSAQDTNQAKVESLLTGRLYLVQSLADKALWTDRPPQ